MLRTGHHIRRKRSLSPALMMAYRQLVTAFEQEADFDELQGAVENLLDSVKAEAKADAARRNLHSWNRE